MLDTGPVVAWLRAEDPDHSASVEALTRSSRAGRILSTTREVIAEAYTLIRYRLAATTAPALKVLDWAATVRVLATDLDDHDRAARILRQHGDLRLSYVDALVLAVTERHRLDELVTLDGELGAVRLKHAVSVTVL